MRRGGVRHDNKPLGKDRPYAGSYSGGDAGYLRMADHYCVHAEGDLVHFVPDSAVRCDMIDYAENKQEAIKKGMVFAKKHASGDICGDWTCRLIQEDLL